MPKFDVDLKDFLRTGEFGPIRLGMTKQETESLLGKPQDWGGAFPWWSEEKQSQASKSALPYADYPVWKYDEMEFHFGDSQKLFLIYCDHLDGLKKYGLVFSLSLRVFNSKKVVTYLEVQRYLASENIAFKLSDNPVFGELILDSGVTIAYEYDDDTVSAISRSNEEFVGAPQET